MDYGYGAVFGCPAHDQRDLDFALKYNLKVKTVVKPFKEDDTFKVMIKLILVQEKFLTHPSRRFKCPEESIIQTIDYLENKLGKKTINFRLEDWGVSRQRY